MRGIKTKPKMTDNSTTIDIHGITCTFIIADNNWQPLEVESLCHAGISAAQTELAATDTLDFKGTLAIKFTDNADLTALNARFRGKTGPTNVLSFPNFEPASEEDSHIGDIAIAYGVTKLEAQRDQKPFQNHITHLIIHGFLHCLGYTHDTDDTAETMETIEIQALKRLNISNPYLLNT